MTTRIRSDAFTGSYVLPGAHPDGEKIAGLHRQVVAALRLRSGITHLELFKTGSSFLVGEITCRPGGGIARGVKMQHGVDLWGAFIDTSPGLTPDWQRTDAPGIVVNCDLPIRPGRIQELADVDTLLQVPGAVSAGNWRVSEPPRCESGLRGMQGP